MQLSSKQREFLDHMNDGHRWNIKTGATRSGKTYLDYFVIPMRIRALAGKPGLVVLLGNTKGTLQRNIIEPMQEIFGESLVGNIRSDNTAMLFGERCYCLGADNIRSVDRIRGSSFKYCYGDEMVSWYAEVLEMLKSRLDKPYSVFDGTCNPSYPTHFVKKFLDSGADIFQQKYTLDDNPFLSPAFVNNLKNEYAGTVFYSRYILGEWTVAEGLVFPQLAGGFAPYALDEDGGYSKVVIGVDFGGNGSRTAFCAVGYHGYERLTILDEYALPLADEIDANDICAAYVSFYRRVLARAGRVDWTFGDSASTTMVNSLVSVARAAGLDPRHIRGCRKNPVSDRPVTVDRLLGGGRLKVLHGCEATMKALQALRWDEKEPDRPEDKNIDSINDIYDAFCYTWLDFVEFIDRVAA